MTELVGPLSEGSVLLQLSVGAGILVVGAVWGALALLGVTLEPSSKPYVGLGAFVLGFVLVFVGHTA